MASPLGFLEDSHIAKSYEVLRPLEEGGGGALFQVRHRQLGWERVVEVLSLPPDEGARQRLEEAAASLGGLRHPHLAAIDDFHLDTRGFAYLVMERSVGRTLAEALALAGPPPLLLALELLAQGLRGLAHLHQHEISHCDVAPRKLLLGLDDGGAARVKWIDLGLARRAEGTGSGSFYLGKVRYACPEQFGADAATADGRVGDIYSYSLLAYELLTGEFPISGESATSVVAGHLFRPPRPFTETDPGSRIPMPLQRLILRGLEKEPWARYEDGVQMLAALEEVRARLPEPDDPAVSSWLAAVLETEARAVEARGVSTEPARGASEPSQPAPPVLASETVDGSHHRQPTLRLADMGRPVGSPPPVPGSVETGRVTELLADLEALIDRGAWDEAWALLEQAEQAYGPHPRLEELHQRLEASSGPLRASPKAAVERTVQERVADDLVARARTFSGAEDFRQAHRLLQEAVELAPQHEVAQTMFRSVEALISTHERAINEEHELQKLVASVEGLVAEGRPGDAMVKLQRAAVRFGDRPELRKLRRSTAVAFLGGDPNPRPPAAPSQVVAPAAVGGPAPAETVPVVAVAPPPPPPSAPEPAEAPMASPRVRSPSPGEHGFGGLDDLTLAGRSHEAASPGPRGVSAPRLEDPTHEISPLVDRKRSGSGGVDNPLTWVLMLLVVVVFLFLGMWLARRSQAPEPEAPQIEVEDVSRQALPGASEAPSAATP